MSVPQPVETIQWIGDVNGQLRLIDQTKLPTEITFITCGDVETVWEAIKMLRVRGAPAIGIAAAYGIIVGLQPIDDQNNDAFFERFDSNNNGLVEFSELPLSLAQWGYHKYNTDGEPGLTREEIYQQAHMRFSRED